DVPLLEVFSIGGVATALPNAAQRPIVKAGILSNGPLHVVLTPSTRNGRSHPLRHPERCLKPEQRHPLRAIDNEAKPLVGGGPRIEAINVKVMGLEGRKKEVTPLDKQIVRVSGESHERREDQLTVPAHHLDIRVSPHGLWRLRLQLGHLVDRGTQPGKPISRSFGIEVELLVSPDMAPTDVEAVSCATALQAQTVHRFYHVGINILRLDGTRRVSFVGAISRSCHIYRERRT